MAATTSQPESLVATAAEKPIELSIPLANDPDSRLSMHIRRPTSANAPLVLFISSSDAGQTTNLGSFVYALPSKPPLKEPMSTTLYSSEESIEFTTRLAKVLVRKVNRPVYVGMGGSFDGPGNRFDGLEERVKILHNITNVVINEISRTD